MDCCGVHIVNNCDVPSAGSNLLERTVAVPLLPLRSSIGAMNNPGGTVDSVSFAVVIPLFFLDGSVRPVTHTCGTAFPVSLSFMEPFLQFR